MSIQNRPAARQIQPMGFSGRLDETRPPTIGKESKGKKSASSPARPDGGSSAVSKVAEASAVLATNMATHRPASDQASQAAARRLTLSDLSALLSCPFGHNITLPDYRLLSVTAPVTVEQFSGNVPAPFSLTSPLIALAI